MRPLVYLLISSLFIATGCAPTAPLQATSDQPAQPVTDDQRRMDAQADSLLALPPSELTETDMDWLRFYEQRRAQRAQQETQQAALDETRRAHNTWLILAGASLAFTVITTVWALNQTDSILDDF